MRKQNVYTHTHAHTHAHTQDNTCNDIHSQRCERLVYW